MGDLHMDSIASSENEHPGHCHLSHHHEHSQSNEYDEAHDLQRRASSGTKSHEETSKADEHCEDSCENHYEKSINHFEERSHHHQQLEESGEDEVKDDDVLAKIKAIDDMFSAHLNSKGKSNSKASAKKDKKP
uniref:Uncharacterized protein n=1 Tax=Lygus hesperus TaxID=30085 RepID=A0A0A9WQU8_LYGHE